MWVGDCFEDLAEIPGPVHLAIGVFDGLHLGHAAVIRRALHESGRSGGTTALLSFQPHPIAVLRPEAAPALLMGMRQKHAVLKAMGVHHLVILPFTKILAAMSAADFVLQLVRLSRPLRHICVGYEWSFGRGRSGNIDLLRKLGAEHGFDVDAIAPVTVDGTTISSTAIRKAVSEGLLSQAATMLGRPYSLFGAVVKGRGLGSKLGFPTANIEVENGVLPPDGVYQVSTSLDEKLVHGVANLGVRPTFGGSTQRMFEVHLLDFDQRLYGRELDVALLAHVREERKFDSVEELRRQIRDDVANVRRSLAHPPVSKI